MSDTQLTGKREKIMEKNVNNLRTRILSLILTMALVVTMMPMNVFAADNEVETDVVLDESAYIASGKCGDTVEWTLGNDNVLTISGTGEMADYTWTNFVPTTPWYDYKTSIKKIVVSDGIISIGASAFYELSYVTEVELSNDILVLGKYAFHGCYNLDEIDLPDSLQYIASDCFSCCFDLTSIDIPESVTRIGSYAFYACDELKDVNLPSNISSLEAATFRGCESLEGIEIPENITTIGASCFYECTALKTVAIPQKVESIGSGAFSGCTSLESVTIPDTVNTIGSEAFRNCTSLANINLPTEIEELSSKLFYGCTSLEEIKVPDSVISIKSNAFYNCTNLGNVVLPSNLTDIGERAFYNCTKLNCIFIPESVTKIGTKAYGYYENIYDEVDVMPDAKVYCFAGSVANEYSENNGIQYSVISINIPIEQCAYSGSEIKPVPNITIDEQNLIQGEDYLLTYNNNINIGTASVQITFINDYSPVGKIQRNFQIGHLLSECNIVLDKEDYQYHTYLPEVIIKSGDYSLIYGTDYEVYYTLAGETWKKPSASTSRYLWALGECVIKIVGLNQYIGEKEFIVEVKKFDLANAKLMTRWTSNGDGTSSSTSFDMQNFEYDGTEKKQSGYRICDNNDTIAVYNYEVSYRDNIDPGTATMIITGKGDYYTGTLEKEFKIYHNHTYKTILTKATTSSNGSSKQVCSVCGDVKSKTTIYKISTVTLSQSNYTYNGKAQKPSVTVKNSKGTTLKNGTDYTISYASGRTKIGKYKVTVKFKGNYSGSKDLYFEIGPKNPSYVKTTLYGYDDVKVSWKKVSGASGYKVYYKKSTASTWSSKTTTGTSIKLANLSDGVKYNIKVVTYKTVKGNKCYNAGKSTSIYTLKKVVGVKAAKSGSKVKVSWTNISGETGYQISKSTKKTGTNIVATYKTTSGKSKTISATKGKTYYYKVRAYKVVDGKKIYGPWSSVVKYKR